MCNSNGVFRIMITRGCIRCHESFTYKVKNENELRGIRTKRYCDECVILNHRDESREYQRNKRKLLQ